METFLVYLKSQNITLKNRNLYWQTDSQSVEYVINKGSRNPMIQTLVFQAKLLSHQLGLEIVTVWTPRDHHRIQICDYYSRSSHSTDEFGLNNEIYRFICQELKVTPTYDGFAHYNHHKCPLYSTIEPMIPTEHCNFFSLNLTSDHVYYLNPPVKLVVHAFRKIINTPKITAILVCPAFPSKNFWPILFPNGPHPCIKQYLIVNTKFENFSKVPNLLCKNFFNVLVLKIVSE